MVKTEKVCVVMAKWPKFTKIEKKHFLFSILAVFGP